LYFPLIVSSDLTHSERVDVIDESDQITETRELEFCPRFGLLHRAVSVFVKFPDGKIYLQQRSNNDDWLPGL
jgi:isopentenyldiphosphate isomerase